jgi:hypothetical protein
VAIGNFAVCAAAPALPEEYGLFNVAITGLAVKGDSSAQGDSSKRQANKINPADFLLTTYHDSFYANGLATRFN